MISLKTYGSDNNNNANSNYIGIPVPVGVSDGDLLIVGITVPAAGITITPPDGWTLIGRTDPASALGVAAYYKFAANEGSRWVFYTSTSCRAPANVVVYSGADFMSPVEAFAFASNTGHTYTTVPTIAASQPFTQLVYILAADFPDTYNPASKYRDIVNRQLNSWTNDVVDIALVADGTVAGLNMPFNNTGAGASMAICIAPSPGLQTLEDVFGRVVGAFPKGADEVYDLTPTGDYYKYFRDFARVLKAYGYDIVDILKQETSPGLTRYKLPDWERAFGLQLSRVAQIGTIPQRQAQVIAAWRAAAGQACSIPEVQSVIAPLLGYNDSADLVIVETDRTALKAAHTYDTTSTLPYTVGALTTKNFEFYVNDDSRVSVAAAQIEITISHNSMENMQFILTGPNSDGSAVDPSTYVPSPSDNIAYVLFDTTTSIGIGSLTNANRIMYTKLLTYLDDPDEKIEGCYIKGTWTLAAINSDGVDDATVSVLNIFVEGLGRDSASGDGLGSAIYDWGVYADPAHLGENGTPADLDAARAALVRMAQAHTKAHLLQSISPYPDEESGAHAAIPDEAIPV